MTVTVRRVLLLTAAGLLTLSALLAVAILLLGSFGDTEGRILATTALLAAFAVAALPGAILLDRRRRPLLAATVLALAVAGGTLAIATVWTDDAPEPIWKTLVTLVVFLLAAGQTALLSLRRSEGDPELVRALFALSTVLAAAVAAMIAVALWADYDESPYLRALAALAVLDLLSAALQPILARARPATRLHRVRVDVEGDGTVELELAARDLADAAAQAIRTVERGGQRALRVELTGPDSRQKEGALLR